MEWTNWHKFLLVLLWRLLLTGSFHFHRSVSQWHVMVSDGWWPICLEQQGKVEQVRLGKKKKLCLLCWWYQYRNMTPLQLWLFSSVATSPHWKKQEHLQQYPKILSGQDCVLVAGERGCGSLRREETLCTTPTRTWECFLCLTQASYGTDWENSALSPAGLGEIFALT